MIQTNCRYFSGYKPCVRSNNCNETCTEKSIVDSAVLIVHLGAMGSVVRSTGLLHAIKENYPNSYIVWMTEKVSAPLLINHPRIDKVLVWNTIDMIVAKSFKFEVIFQLDKDVSTWSWVQDLKYNKIKGFKGDSITGGIIPIDSDAEELWSLGLSNTKKFFENKKTELALLYQACGFEYYNQRYDLPLNDFEKKQALERKKNWQIHFDEILIGINTGCSPVLKNKKIPKSKIVAISERIWSQWPQQKIVLLGGPSETSLHNELAQVDNRFISSPTENGPRCGLVSMQTIDVLITGDTLGLHLAVALKKFVIAWFGPSCQQEIDLFNNGIKLISEKECSPCWNRNCQEKSMCNDELDVNNLSQAVHLAVEKIRISKTGIRYSNSLTNSDVCLRNSYESESL